MADELAFDGLVLLLGGAAGFLSGLLGIGGGIVLAPALLYLPPALGLGALHMREVGGLTISQALFASVAAAVRHDRNRRVHRRLAAPMGAAIFVASLGGALLSDRLSHGLLLAVLAALAGLAALLMLLAPPDAVETAGAGDTAFRPLLAGSLAAGVGFLGGLVGQGGSFLLIPLMLVVLRLPTRTALGTNLVLAFASSLAGFVGKLATAQVLLLPAALLVAGAVPGAVLGSIVCERTRPRWLRAGLAALILLAAARMGGDAFLHGFSRP